MGVPSPGSLSLSEAINYIVQRCGCSEREAKEALRRAAQESLLEASGDIPLSAHPNPKVRDAHPVRKREALRAADWGDQLDWATGKVGRYYSVTIERASIEAWLIQGQETPSAAPISTPDAEIHKSKARNYIAAEGAEEAGEEAPDARERPLTEKAAQQFIEKYIVGKEERGERPTLKDAEAAAHNAGYRGGRHYLRTAFHKLLGPVKLGRPPNSPPKFAKK